MAEEEYMDWAVEKRIEMLSEQERMPDQEEALKEMDGLLEGGLKAAERTRVTGGGHVSGWNRHRLQRSQGRCP